VGHFVAEGVVGVEHDLDDAVGVAEVDEDEATVVSTAMDPAGELHLAAGIGGVEVPAECVFEH